MPDAATELARQTFEGVQALRAVVGSLEGKMMPVAKLVGEDHDSITTMKGALESIQSATLRPRRCESQISPKRRRSARPRKKSAKRGRSS